MVYSSIKQKYGHCVDCPPGTKDQPLTAGRCPTHYKIFRTLANEEKNRARSPKLIVNERTSRIFTQPIPPKIETIAEFKKKMTPPKNSETKALEKQAKTELDKWFEYVATFIKAEPYCWECNSFVPKEYYKHATAHIFPKKLFPSVATHPFNWLLLPAGCCHDKSHRLDTFSQMKVWEEAVKRFRIFEPCILEIHNKYYTLFKQYADDTCR